MEDKFLNPARADRMKVLVHDLTRDELIQTTLRAIDHAYGASAELQSSLAAPHDLVDRNEQLADENRALKNRVDALERSRAYRLGLVLSSPMRLIRRISSK